MAAFATIYVLFDSRATDPVAGVRYVGRTVTTLDRRLKGHRYEAFHGDRTHRGRWIRSVYATGGEVAIQAVASVPIMWIDAAEIDLIAKYRALGCQLTNLTDGGGGLLNASPETRQRIGAAKRGHKFWVGKKHTAEAKAKMAAARLGRPNPKMREVTARPEVRAKIAATLKARTLTDEELTKKREHINKVWHSNPEWRAKIQATSQTPEVRAMRSAIARRPKNVERMRLLGQSHRGRKHTEAFRAACAARGIGRQHTEATKQKMSAWQRGGQSHRAKLTWHLVDTIRRRYAEGGISQHQLAREYHVQPRTINLIVHHKTWVAA